jgi:penicillin amidase
MIEYVKLLDRSPPGKPPDNDDRRPWVHRRPRPIVQAVGAWMGARMWRYICVACAAAFGGCAALTQEPLPVSGPQRLAELPTADLPLAKPVVIHWNDNLVPFVVAEEDGDAAFALGLVHAHLRLGQMEMMRHIAQGRLAEAGGPYFIDIDHAIRILGLGRAAPEIIAGMPPETRAWLDRFVQGVNHYQNAADRLPHEFAVMGLEREPWTIEDIVTLGRLIGSDVNWLSWFNLLPLRDLPEWPEIWQALLANGSMGAAAFQGLRAEEGDEAAEKAELLARLIAGSSRSGSNSIAVAGSRTASRAGLLASDPHLGITVPGAWLLAGLKSPTYHVAGLMPAGVPVFGLGRNPDAAWGGTNMRAASSELFDVSDLQPSEIRTETQRIKVRFWLDREVKVRVSPWGPLISDADILPGVNGRTLALKWIGHLPSDEFTALLKASRARSFDDFKDAFATFAVSAQNMLYADRQGVIGQVAAARLPRRDQEPPGDLVLQPVQGGHWQTLATSRELGGTVNPRAGFIASANNRPDVFNLPVGFFFSPPDRIARLQTALAGPGTIGVDELKSLQRDVTSLSSLVFRDRLLRKIDENEPVPADPKLIRVLALIRGWDGAYRADSVAALAFEAFFAEFAPRLYDAVGKGEVYKAFARSSAAKMRAAEDLDLLQGGRLAAALEAALAAAADVVEVHRTWGAVHRLQLKHYFGGIPLLGGRYRFLDLPTGGSQETLMKAAHPAEVSQPHATTYGSQSRHVSDLSDPDANDFVLLGGQDGWLGSDALLDQVPLWQAGKYVRVPLRLEAVRATFRWESRLQPATRTP